MSTKPASPVGRRQWGSDRRSAAPPAVHPPISDRRLAVGRLGIVVTVVAWCAYFGVWLFTDLLNAHRSSAVDRAESIAYLLVVTLLTGSSLAYLLSRLGFFYRARSHHRETRLELEEFYETTTPTLTMIVPSYQEETRVIRATLLSAALQEYPNKRIVLLIDDPPAPRRRRARELLTAPARSRPRSTTCSRRRRRATRRRLPSSRTRCEVTSNSMNAPWSVSTRTSPPPPHGCAALPPITGPSTTPRCFS